MLRKLFGAIVLLALIAAFFIEFLLPTFAAGALKAKVVSRLATDDVTVAMDASPEFLLALGHADRLEVLARQAKVGSVTARELTLSGEGVDVDVPAFLSDSGIQVRRAKKLTLKGIIGEEELRRALQGKVDRMENISVSITPEGIRAEANAKIFGRTADVELTGEIVDDAGALYFRMTSLSLKNAMLGTARLGDMFGDVELLGAGKLPLGLKITNVEQRDGVVLITAERPASM